ncbi:MAG: DUF2127 domain-containing protein [Acidobacteriota bacterium]|nr:DUF2127 domain-containing protein [Acidobacteriota bacterium]
MAKRSRKQAGDKWIIAIGIFKLAKALSLLVLGVGLVRLLHRDVGSAVGHWLEVLRLDPDNRYIHGALVRVFRITPKQLRELSAGTFIYAAIFLTEGIGLLLRKHWAEYLTVVSTGLFIPLEVYEIYHRFTAVRAGLLVVNVAIIWYLAMRVRRR